MERERLANNEELAAVHQIISNHGPAFRQNFFPREALHARCAPELLAAGVAEHEIDGLLDAFAKAGSNLQAFIGVLYRLSEPDFYYLYKVTRAGVVGYCPREGLTREEGLAIAEQLRREGDACMREAEELGRYGRERRHERN